MPSWLWILFATTIPVALMFGAITFFNMRKKISDIKKEMFDDTKPIEFELLLSLKKDEKIELGDVEMKFILNTIVRNNYHKTYIFGFLTNYEKSNISQLGKQHIVETGYDFALLNAKADINEVFDETLKGLKKGGMIVVTNASKKQRDIKRLLDFLHLTNIKNEFIPLGKGIIIATK